MKIVFFGTSRFAAKILEYLLRNSFDIKAVVTRPDRPQGRSLQLQHPPVKIVAQELAPSVPIHQPEKASTPEFADVLKKYEADLFLVVAYGEIIKQLLLDIPKKTCMNVHASLLPKYRGAAPMQRCLMNGEKQSGITLIEMVLQMDAGDMIASAAIEISPDMTGSELEEALLCESLKLVPQVLTHFDEYYQKKIAQDPSQVTFASKILPEDLLIDWKRSAIDLHNTIRAFSPSPCAWCKIKIGGEEKRLKIKLSKPIQNALGAPGEYIVQNKGLIVSCGTGALELREVQLEGKKTMSSADFLKGLNQPFAFPVE